MTFCVCFECWHERHHGSVSNCKKPKEMQCTGSPDSNVEKNRELLLQRSIVGLKKYGVTTEDNPLTLREWLQHALEESLDMANYLQAAITKIDNEEKTK